MGLDERQNRRRHPEETSRVESYGLQRPGRDIGLAVCLVVGSGPHGYYQLDGAITFSQQGSGRGSLSAFKSSPSFIDDQRRSSGSSTRTTLELATHLAAAARRTFSSYMCHLCQ